MTDDGGILPTGAVEELVRVLGKALRAFQMYLPNNPMYQRAEEQLREAFAPLWEVQDEVTFLVNETELHWEDQVVYSQPSKSESFAFALYKEGMRVLRIRKGAEEGEVSRFLQTVTRARLLPVDAGDDLLTLVWQEDFQLITYEFAEVILDPWVYDPQALSLGSVEPETNTVQAMVREDAAAAPPKPEGMVDLEEFDSTLYFLDEIEIAALNSQVEDEYHRDARAAALNVLFDLLELESSAEVHGEVLGVIEALFPSYLSQGDFRTVALILREFRVIVERAKTIGPDARARMERLEAELSQPATIAQLLQFLDEAEFPPSETELGEVLGQLRPTALGAILTQLPRLASESIREVTSAAANRLAAANPAELLGLLAGLDEDALPQAIRITTRLGLQAGIPILTEHARHQVPAVRLAAVEALAQLGTPSAMAGLEPALVDEDRAVRVAAVAAIGTRKYGGALRRLEAMVTGKVAIPLERGEKRQVFETYAVVAGPAGVETLKGIALPQGLFRRKGDPETRTCAVYGLGRLRTPEARLAVEELTGDKELSVRHAAVTLLRDWPT